jgi:hypothetical protein
MDDMMTIVKCFGDAQQCEEVTEEMSRGTASEIDRRWTMPGQRYICRGDSQQDKQGYQTPRGVARKASTMLDSDLVGMR